jgi:hypothetical protein
MYFILLAAIAYFTTVRTLLGILILGADIMVIIIMISSKHNKGDKIDDRSN